MTAPGGTPPPITRDSVLGGRVVVNQPSEGYRAAVDPVLLAAAVPARDRERVLDLGTGVGTAALCLAARVPACAIVGLELQPDLVGLALANVAVNDMTARVTILEGSVAGPPGALGDGYDHVMLNPPYMPAGRSGAAEDDPSCVEGEPLAVWLECALARVRVKGTITVIHRADRTDEVVAGLVGPAGAVEIIPIWPKAGADARRVIVRARRGVATPTRIAPGLVLHEPDGAYTAAADAILRDGRALET